MTFEAILYEVEDNILTITFNRPDAMNAFSGPMFGELFTALDMADADD
ncbi:MAG: enoyl-CoA hydratase/carnithine racemase, partial [Dinoroseobacter sp.]